MHGGRDLKEGSIASMWRLNLSSIHQMLEEDGTAIDCEWELVQTTGRGPGRISHHTVSVRPSKEVVFYGGLKGEDSNAEIFLFNPNTNAWLSVNPSVSRADRDAARIDFAVTNSVYVELFAASAAP